VKILAPISSPDEVDALVDAGAAELYCGVLSPAWRRAYSSAASINRVERRMGNLDDYDALEKLTRAAHERGAAVNFCLNGQYSAPQYGRLEAEIDGAVDAGVDAILVADVAMLLHLRAREVPVELHLSTGGSVFNGGAAAFFGGLGVTRIVVPRSLRISEIAQLVGEHPDLVFEVFVLNGGCMSEDGLCTFQHGLKDGGLSQSLLRSAVGRRLVNTVERLPSSARKVVTRRATSALSDNACVLPYEIEPHGRAGADLLAARQAARRVHASSRLGHKHMNVCGACRLWEFRECGVGVVKIVGRTFTTEHKVRDVRFIASLLGRLESGESTRLQFTEHARRAFQQTFGQSCEDNCFYPA